MNELYREALDCLAKASNLLTEARELELAGAVVVLVKGHATVAKTKIGCRGPQPKNRL